MKKFTFAALAACLLLTGCGNNGGESASTGDTSTVSVAEKTPAERTSELLDTVELPEMSEVTSDKLLAYYGIDEADVTEFSAYVAGAGVYPDEFGVFVAADEAAAEKIFEKLEKRIEKQKSTYADYSPDEMYKFDGAYLAKNGVNIGFAVCADNDAAAEILR